MDDVGALPSQCSRKNAFDNAGAGDENVTLLRQVVAVWFVDTGQRRDHRATTLGGRGRVRRHCKEREDWRTR